MTDQIHPLIFPNLQPPHVVFIEKHHAAPCDTPRLAIIFAENVVLMIMTADGGQE